MTPAARRARNLLLTRSCSPLLITHGYVTESADLSRCGLISVANLWLICVFMITISFSKADSIRVKLSAVIINEYIYWQTAQRRIKLTGARTTQYV